MKTLITVLFWLLAFAGDVCQVRVSRKRPCGYGMGTNPEDCSRLGCCFEKNTQFAVPDCFHPVVEFQEQRQQGHHRDPQTILVTDRCIQQRSKEECLGFLQGSDRCMWTGEYCVVGDNQHCNLYKEEDACKGRLYNGKACFWNDYYCAEGDVLDCESYESAHDCQRAFHIGFTCIWEINHDRKASYSCKQDPKDYRDMMCDDYIFEGDCAGQTQGLKTCKWVNDECVIHGVFDCESLGNERDCVKQGCDWGGDECVNPVGGGSGGLVGGAGAGSGGEVEVDCESPPSEDNCNNFSECFWSHEEGECLDIAEMPPNYSSTSSTDRPFYQPIMYPPQQPYYHGPYQPVPSQPYNNPYQPLQTQPYGDPPYQPPRPYSILNQGISTPTSTYISPTFHQPYPQQMYYPTTYPYSQTTYPYFPEGNVISGRPSVHGSESNMYAYTSPYAQTPVTQPLTQTHQLHDPIVQLQNENGQTTQPQQSSVLLSYTLRIFLFLFSSLGAFLCISHLRKREDDVDLSKTKP